jgi:hypothetical protein
MTRGIHLLGVTALLFMAALLALYAASDTRAAPPVFEPGGMICFENLDTSADCDGDTAAGASPDIRSKFCVGWGGDCGTQPLPANVKDSNFGQVAALVPTAFVPNEAGATPVGAIAGYLTASSVLGLLNGPCNSTIQVAFSLLNASTDLNDTIAPKPVGLSDPGEPLALDANTNGIPDGADKYPTFLKSFFKDQKPRARLFGVSRIQGSWITLNFLFFEPGARVETTSGIDTTFKAELGLPSVTVLGDPSVSPSPSAISDFCAPLMSANVTLGKSMDNPCTPTPVDGGNCPGGDPPRSNVGYPLLPCETGNALDEDGNGKINDGCPQRGPTAESGAQCDNNISDDPSQAAPEDSDINDGCPAVGSGEAVRIPGDCTGGDEGGCTIRRNPDNGTYKFTIVAGSQRDADNDGIENSLDVCSKDSNPEWNPRAVDAANDSDGDGMPKPCDPDDTKAAPQSPLTCSAGIVGNDQDQDCFANRADNCPNDNQLKNPSSPPDPTENVPDIKDTDYDGIGDACDDNDNAANGENIGYCIEFSLNVGQPAGPVVGVRNSQGAPECAASAFTQGEEVPGQGQVTGTRTTTTTNTQTGTQTGGVGSGPVTGVGSLSPVSRDVPVWAAALAAIGGLGIIAGLGLLTRSAVRRRIR